MEHLPLDSLEGLMDMDALVLAYPDRGAVHEADPRTLVCQHLLGEQGKK